MKTLPLKKALSPIARALHLTPAKTPAAARALDSFVPASAPRGMPVLDPVAPKTVQAAKASTAAAVSGPAKSPYYLGRVHRDGRAMVGEDGQAFTWRGVSEFLLPLYLTDTSRPPEEREAIVAKRMDERVQQGYSTLRVFGTLHWDNAKVHPFDDFEGYKAAMEKMVSMAEERGLYVELTALTGVGESIPRSRVGEYVDFIAQLASRHPNTFVELCNESFKNGMSKDELYDAARRFKQTAANVMLAGSSPVGDGVDGTDEGGVTFAKPPFDYVTLHPERGDGDDGYRWVRHLREGEGVGGTTNLPVVQDEPIGSFGTKIPGRRDNDAKHFRDAALVAAVTNQGFTFHTERAVTVDPYAQVPEPGADMTRVSDLIPPDPRGTHFVNGHWADSPFDPGKALESDVLRIFTKMKDDRSGFWTYPVQVKNDIDLKLRQPTHLVVVDVETGNRLEDRDFAAGEALHLARGADVVIYGGNAAVPEIKKPGSALPSVPGGDQEVPGQAVMRTTRDATMSGTDADAAVEKLYRGVFGRDVEPSHPWAEWFARGQYSMAINGLVQSSEFTDKRPGLSAAVFADRLYREIAGRPAGDDLAAAVERINQGKAAELVHDLFVSNTSPGTPAQPAEPIPAQRPIANGGSPRYSDAQATRIVERLYEAVLGREGDAGGVQAWKPQVMNGNLRRVVNGFVQSQEFKDKAAGTDVAALSNRLYTALLDRDGDELGLEGTKQLVRSGRLADRVFAMLLSAEYKAKN